MPDSNQVIEIGANESKGGVTIAEEQGTTEWFLSDMPDATGEDQMKDIHNRMYGGSATGRSSFWRTLFRGRGSVILRVIPISLLGAFFAFCLVMASEMMPDLYLLPELKHPFVVQVFGIILSFVIVARNNVAVDRYFDGMEHVHTMSSRWVDSFTSLLGFLRASYDLHPAGSPKQEACVALSLGMLHWGTLSHALAINSLQATQLGLDEKIWEHRIAVLEPPENLTLDSTIKYEPSSHTKSKQNKSRARLTKAAMTAEKRVSITDTGVAREVDSKKVSRELVKLGVFGKPSPEEVARLHGTTDKIAIVLMWMEEAVSRAQVQGVLLIAPPILARVYNELGNGLMGFNSAYRIALVPFPFCFAQIIGWCLVIFVFLCPAVAYVFTGGEMLTSSLTFCSLMGFWGLNRIAIELENPFGTSVNHLPMAELHHTFAEALGEMLTHPMPEYKWDDDPLGDHALPVLKRNLVGK